VPRRVSSKKVADSAPEIIFTLSGFHCLPENCRRSSSPGYEALAGFFSASFEGGRKSGGEGRPLLEYSVDLSQTRQNNDSLYEIQFESASFRLD